MEFEVQALMGRKIGTGGEPNYLVRWRGYSAAEDSWEPWGPLGACLGGIRAFHAAQFEAGTAPLGYAPGCPSTNIQTDDEVRRTPRVEPSPSARQSVFCAERPHGACPDAQLVAWRITSKRTPSGREYRVYYGPLGEHVRSRNIALQLASLYDLPADLPRIPTPPPTNGTPTANGHANALAAVASVDTAGATASAAAIAASHAAARAHLGLKNGDEAAVPATTQITPATAAPATAAPATAAPATVAASATAPSTSVSPTQRTKPPAVLASPLPSEAAALADALFQ